jgi:hypothetical protein
MAPAEWWVIRHGGRDFYATAEMARIFRRQAERIVASGVHELVVLRHSSGVDMVLIAGASSFSISEATGVGTDPAQRHVEKR